MRKLLALYIVLGVLVLILLLCHLGISVIIEFNESFSLKIRILFVTYDVTKPRKPKRQKKPKPAREKKKRKMKPKRRDRSPVPPKAKKKIKDIFDFISFITRIAKAASKRLVKLTGIKLCYYELACSQPEAEKTAILYAQLSNASYALFEVLKRFARFSYDAKTVFIYPDFTKTKPVFRIKLIIKLRLIYFLSGGAAALGILLKRKK